MKNEGLRLKVTKYDYDIRKKGACWMTICARSSVGMLVT